MAFKKQKVIGTRYWRGKFRRFAQNPFARYFIERVRKGESAKRKEAFNSATSKEKERLLDSWFYGVRGEHIDFNNPRTFSEKIQWLKLYDRPELKGSLADKYLVRDYVAKRIGADHLVPLLGVWDSAESITFRNLPRRYVLKATHGAGWNVIVSDSSQLNEHKVRKKMRDWLNTDFAYVAGYEPHYSFCTPRIIAEEFIDQAGGLTDYKVFCFDGRPLFIEVVSDRDKGHPTTCFVDLSWKKIDWHTASYPISDTIPQRPTRLDELIDCASKLSGDFSFVRTDFYITERGVLFGEMTFTPASGVAVWAPKGADEELGSYLSLPT